jgi:hypothetical protein
MKKQTALEYFLNLTIPVTSEEIETARKMEKEQIIEAWQNGAEIYDESAAQYFNETYGGDK